MKRRSAVASLFLSSLIAACGGGGSADGSANAMDASSDGRASILKVLTPTTGPSPLPTTAPAPDILVRESFGMGPNSVRPAGGKGDLRAAYGNATIAGFWVEWPGSKATAWLSPPETGQSWRFCGANPSPGELPSPLQGDESNGFLNAGCAFSQFIDLPVTQHPTALLPFTPPATAYAVSISAWPVAVEGAYVAVGMTSSSVLMSNFETVGDVWLSLRRPNAGGTAGFYTLTYELRVNGRTGPLLATGEIADVTWNKLLISYDPVTQMMSASAGDVLLGPFPMRLAPKYAGFEGVGSADNFVIRKLASAVQ